MFYNLLSGNCIMQVWDHGSALQPCKCPLCRREITLLVPGGASLRHRQDPHISDILRKVETYNRRFGGRDNGLFQVSGYSQVHCLLSNFSFDFLFYWILWMKRRKGKNFQGTRRKCINDELNRVAWMSNGLITLVKTQVWVTMKSCRRISPIGHLNSLCSWTYLSCGHAGCSWGLWDVSQHGYPWLLEKYLNDASRILSSRWSPFIVPWLISMQNANCTWGMLVKYLCNKGTF